MTVNSILQSLPSNYFKGLSCIQIKIIYSGGNTTTGPLAWRFLSIKKRPHIVDLYHFESTDDQRKFSNLIQRLNVILRIMISWKRKVNLERFSPYVLETHIILNAMFPWMKDNGTFHQSYNLYFMFLGIMQVRVSNVDRAQLDEILSKMSILHILFNL